MLIVGLNGSPNKEGNTKFLLNQILEKSKSLGADTKIMEVPELINSTKQKFCVFCSNPCTGVCHKDTKLGESFEILKKADAVLVGSPTYFGSVSGQLKAFFDKTRKLRQEFGLYNKVAAGVTVAAAKYGGQEATMKTIHDLVIGHGMIIVGDGFKEDDCGHHGVSAQAPANKDEFSIWRAKVLAKRLVDLCNATKCLRE